MSTHKPSFLKQLGGAAAGMMVALGLYGVWETAKPVVTAYLTIPGVEKTDTAEFNASNKTIDANDPQSRAVLRIQRQAIENAEPTDVHAAAAVSSAPAMTVTVESSSSAAWMLTATESSSSSRKAIAPITEGTHAAAAKGKGKGAPNLPGAGVKEWTAVLAAFTLASMLHPRIRRRALHLWHSWTVDWA